MNKIINKKKTLSLIDHLAIVVNDVSKSVEYYSKNFICNIKFKDDTWSLLEFQNINLALVTQEKHPNHFAVVDENLSKNNNMKYMCINTAISKFIIFAPFLLVFIKVFWV